MDNTNKSETIVVSYCQSNEIDENNIILGTMQWWTNDVNTNHWLTDYANEGSCEVTNYLSFKNTIPDASAVFFKKSAYQQVNKNYLRMKYCGDWLLWTQLFYTGNIAYTSQPLNFFRKHIASTRTMNSVVKLRTRLEEEYYMSHYIKKNFRYC